MTSFELTPQLVLEAFNSSEYLMTEYSEFTRKASTPNYFNENPSKEQEVLRTMRCILGFFAEFDEFLDAVICQDENELLSEAGDELLSEAGDVLFWFSVFKEPLNFVDNPVAYFSGFELINVIEKWSRDPLKKEEKLSWLKNRMVNYFFEMVKGYSSYQDILLESLEDVVVLLESIARSNQQKLIASPRISFSVAPALEMIKKWEGFESEAYPDPAHGWEVPTIGYGTTRYKSGAKVTKGDTIAEPQALAELEWFVQTQIVPVLQRTVPCWMQLNGNQKNALISFSYNLGSHWFGQDGFNSMTVLMKEFPNKNVQAKRIFMLYSKSNGQTLEGLVRRREDEAELFSQM
jgi:GH24 family phage-related lysozyme (muramidase)